MPGVWGAVFKESAQLGPAWVTTLFLGWLAYWILLHLYLRRGRAYAADKIAANKNSTYKFMSILLTVQNFFCILMFWRSDGWLLKFHDTNVLRLAGLTLLFAATALYTWAAIHLGGNYAPCYDSYRPHHLVSTGPYRLLRA